MSDVCGMGVNRLELFLFFFFKKFFHFSNSDCFPSSQPTLTTDYHVETAWGPVSILLQGEVGSGGGLCAFCLPESIYFIFSKDLRGASIIITYHCLFTNAIPDFESSHFKDDNCPCSCEYSFQNLGFE